MKRIKQFLRFSRHKIRSKPKARSWMRYSLYAIATLFGLGVFSTLAVLAWVYPQLPDLDNLEDLVASQSSIILDRDGNLLYRIHGDENRKVVPFESISPNIVYAILAIEDDQFYNHTGFDSRAIMKAICSELGLCSKARGGSTITQQYIKNAFLSSERTYTRKLKELLLAVQLEKKYSKDEVIALYLNRISFGSNIYGVELAAQNFFGKSAQDLEIEEAAVLAALPNAPTYYSPYGNNRYAQIVNISPEEIVAADLKNEHELVNKDRKLIKLGLLGKTYTFGEEEEARDIYVKGRVDFVIGRMKDLGYITNEEAIEAIQKSNELSFNVIRQEIRAPHFVFYVRQLLEEKYGQEQLEKGGLSITTTLDPSKQKIAEEAISKQVGKNLQNYDANNAALISIHPDTGEILAMVGSKDYWNQEIDGNVNVTTSVRSPGSSIKPIVYAAAFLRGFAPATVVYDVKTKFSGWYEPQNSNGRFAGPVSFRRALGASLNIPAIKAGHLAGIPNVLELARKMGLELPLSDSDYGLSLTLGAGEVSPLNMAKAYSIFANGGYNVEPMAVLKIEDRNGNLLEEFKQQKKEDLILDPEVAYLITDILADRSARPDAFWRDQLTIPGQINAAKTGTSNGKRNGVNYPQDGWAIGYTRHLTTAVWAGNTSGKLMKSNGYGLNIAAPIWKDYMTQATAGIEKIEFEKPDGLKYVQVSKRSGFLPSKHTSAGDIITEVFASFSLLVEKDESYRIIEIDKVSGKLATEYTPEAAKERRSFYNHTSILPEDEHWQRAVQAWAAATGQGGNMPTEYDDVHTAESMANPPQISITSPSPNATLAPPAVTVQANVRGDRHIKQVDYYWDGTKVGTATGAPYSLRITIPQSAAGSVHTLKAVVMDDWYRVGQSSTSITIGSDTTPPNLSFAYPKNGSIVTVNSSLAIQANASDDHGAVKNVEAFVNGKSLGSKEQGPYSWNWLTTEKGEYTLKLSANDYAGNNQTISQNITVKEAASTPTEGGGASISAPSSVGLEQAVPVTVSISAEDAANITSVEILVKPEHAVRGETVATVAGTPGTQTYTLIWGGGAVGSYEIYAKLVISGSGDRFTQRRTVKVE